MNEPIFNVLDPHETFKKRLFLEASAGTGKTFTIEHFVIRLIVEKGLDIDEILVVTFTNKATRELVERIEKLMEAAIEALRRAEQKDQAAFEYFPYLRAIDDLAERRAHLEKSLQQFNKAAISTLHGFAHSALKKCDLASIISYDETPLKEFIAEVVSNECAIGALNPFHIQKLKRRYPTAEELFLEIERAASAGSSIDEMPTYSELMGELLKRLSALKKPGDIDELYEDLAQLGEGYKGILNREKKIKRAFHFPLNQLFNLAKNDRWTLEKVSAFAAAFEPIVKALSPSNQKKNKSEEGSEKSLIQSYAKAFYGLETFLYDSDVTLYTLASALISKKKELGHLHSPDDYLNRFEELVQDPSLKEQLSSQVASSFRAVIIDEFQDTDPAQWTIFSNLFFSNPAIDYALVVGDPKQSIYGFRKADIYTFFSAKTSFIKDSCYRLSTNFRSSAKLTAVLNALFSLKKDRTFLWLPKLKQSIPFTPSLSPSVDKQVEISDPVKAFISKKSPDLKSQEKVIFPWVYREIITLIESGTPLNEIALLVSDRYQMQAIASFLSKEGIETQCHRDLPLKEQNDWKKLKGLFEALYSDKRQAQLKAALFIEHPKVDIFSPEYKKCLSEAFRKAKEVLSERGLLQALLEFELPYWIDRTLLRLAEEFESFWSEKGFLNWEVYRAIEAFEEEYTDEIESAADAIQVMTIHKSKGLEFLAVIALGLVQPSRGLARAIEVDGKVKLKSLASESEISAEEDELDAEKLRAFYVCTTRAKSQLFIPIMTGERIARGKTSMNGAFFSRALEGYEIESEYLGQVLRTIGVQVIFEDQLELGKRLSRTKEENKDIRVLQSGYQLPFDSSWMCTAFEPEKVAISYSSLHQQSNVTTEAPAENAAIDEPKGPEIGTQLHEVLRIIFERGWHGQFGIEVFNRAARSVIPKSQLDQHQAYFYAWVKKALETPISEIGALSTVAWENLAVEQPFYLQMGDGKDRIQGVIDLVVHHEGKIFIIDWKSNAMCGYSTEHLEHTMHTHGYFLQASFYRYAVEQIIWPWKGATFSKAVYFFVRGDKPVIFEPDLLKQSALRIGQYEAALCL